MAELLEEARRRGNLKEREIGRQQRRQVGDEGCCTWSAKKEAIQNKKARIVVVNKERNE